MNFYQPVVELERIALVIPVGFNKRLEAISQVIALWPLTVHQAYASWGRLMSANTDMAPAPQPFSQLPAGHGLCLAHAKFFESADAQLFLKIHISSF